MMTRLICRVFGHKRIVVPIGDRPLEYAGEIVGFEKDAVRHQCQRCGAMLPEK